MNADGALSRRIIWATRGSSWGFRFLLDAGIKDPLAEYERAFDHLQDEPAAWRRTSGRVALRFSDPSGRRDSAGRLIPHEFVLFDDLADAVDSVDAGIHAVWPLVAEVFAAIWDAEHPPHAIDLSSAHETALARGNAETPDRDIE